MRLGETDIAGREPFECDGCHNTFIDSDENIEKRTYDWCTYCPKCWKLGEFESEEEDIPPKNQIY